MRGLWLPFAGLTLLSAFASANEGGREVARLANGNVSVNARGTALGSLLKQFGALTALDVALVDHRAETASVDFSVRDLPLTDALTAMLQSSGVGFVLWGQEGTDGGLRLIAYPPGASANASDGKQVAANVAPGPPPPLELPPDMDPAVAAAIRQGIAADDPDLAMIGTGAPEKTLNPEDDPDLAEILGPPRKDDGAKQP